MLILTFPFTLTYAFMTGVDLTTPVPVQRAEGGQTHNSSTIVPPPPPPPPPLPTTTAAAAAAADATTTAPDTNSIATTTPTSSAVHAQLHAQRTSDYEKGDPPHILTLNMYHHSHHHILQMYCLTPSHSHTHPLIR